MAWGRCDDGYHRHRKIADLSETLAAYPLRLAAVGLEWLAISWSNAQLADGVITAATIRMLGGTIEIADELVRVGRWERPAIGTYLIHDYGGYNKLKAEVLADRKAEADRQADWRRNHPDRARPPRRPSRRDNGRDKDRDTRGDAPAVDVENPVSQRDTAGDTQPVSRDVSLARPVSRIPSPVDPGSRAPENSPPPPAQRGSRSKGTNPRAVGANPRATGDAPRQNGESPRQERQAEKRRPTALGEIMAEAQRRAAGPQRPNGHTNGQASLFDEPAG